MKNITKHNKYLMTMILLVISIIITTSSGCFENEPVTKVSLERTELIKNENSMEETFKIGVYTMYSPRLAMEYYQDFFIYLSEMSGTDYELVQRDNPKELLYLLETNYLDALLIREEDYKTAHNDFGMEIVVIPVVHGDIYYDSYVITRSDEKIDSIEDLQGKSFAFNSFRFNQGSIVPDYMEPFISGSPDNFFSSYTYSNNQDNFVDQILRREIDAAEIDCLVWEHIVEDSPEYSLKLKIIHESPPQLVPVLGVNPDIDEGSKDELKDLLLEMHNNPEGRKVLKNMHYDMFIEIGHDTYISESI